MLSEAPLEAVRQVEVSQLALAVLVVSHSLARLEPWGLPRMNGVTGGRIHWEVMWQVRLIYVRGVHQMSRGQVQHHTIRHFNSVVCLLSGNGH